MCKAEKHDLGVVFMEQIILDGSQRGLENGKMENLHGHNAINYGKRI